MPANDPELVVLIARCQRGDLSAFDQLVKRYEKRIFNLAYRLSGNYDDANDITSEAFIRIFNALQKYRGEARFSTWIYRIVMNTFLDEKKKRSHSPQVSLEELLETEEGSMTRQVESEGPQPQDLVERDERRDVVQEALNQLPEFQRLILTLFHIENLSYEEIAEILHMPLGTVKSRLNRARRALRDKLMAHRELFGV